MFENALNTNNPLTPTPSDKYIKLEDIVSRFRKPCIMDVKVGRRVWDDFAEQDKIDREKRKYPPQEIIGFRIIGMRVSGGGREGEKEGWEGEGGRTGNTLHRRLLGLGKEE